jgi:hypothetical protein
MKKIYSLLVAFIVFMFPFATYAAVNITLREGEAGNVAIEIDTETDTLESITLPVSYSEGVEITDVTDGDVTCSELSYTESQGTVNTILVTCKLDSATALDGVLANIAFTSTGDTPATFEVVESDDLDLGTLTLGETVSFEQTNTVPTTEEMTTTGEDTQPTTTETPTVGGDPMVTTEQPTTTTETSLLDSITEYLPYILIAGSVILLISIVVLLLRKDKGPKQPKVKKGKKGEQNQMPPVVQPEQQSERFLRDMVNNPNSAPTQTTPTTEVTPPTPMSQNTQQTPPQPAYTQKQQSTPPIMGTTQQEEDLQEILQRESSVPTAMGDSTPQAPQPNQNVPFSTGFSAPQQQENPEDIMPEPPQPQVNPMQQPETQPQMPPVTSPQNPSTDNTSEEIPPVPPTM